MNVVVVGSFTIIDIHVDGGGGDAPHAPGEGDADDKTRKAKAERSLKQELVGEHRVAKMGAAWVEDSVEVGNVITFPTGQDDVPFNVIQFLAVQERLVLPPTYKDVPNKKVWNIQPFAISRPDLLGDDPQKVDIFKSGEPTNLDFLHVLAVGGVDRLQVRKWELADSDVVGCDQIHSPAQLQPRTALTAPGVPVLSLIDALSEWVGVSRKITHHRRSGRLYDDRELYGKRNYLQAVLASTWLFSHGQESFNSARPQAYYVAILGRPGKVDEKLSGKECRQLIALADGDPVLTPTLDIKAPKPKSRAALMDISGDEGAAPAPPKAKRSRVDEVEGDECDVPSTPSSTSSSKTNCSGDESDAKARSISGDSDSSGSDSDKDAPHIPRRIDGRLVVLEEHEDRKDRGLRISCPVHGHTCRGYRSIFKDVDKHGRYAATFFLGAWLRKAKEMPMQTHRKYKPNSAAIREYIQSLPR